MQTTEPHSPKKVSIGFDLIVTHPSTAIPLSTPINGNICMWLCVANMLSREQYLREGKYEQYIPTKVAKL